MELNSQKHRAEKGEINNIETLTYKAKTQQEALDFIEGLLQKTVVSSSIQSLRGACAHLKVQITEEDIRATREEMWSNFPREVSL